jgi:hypothetical protein
MKKAMLSMMMMLCVCVAFAQEKKETVEMADVLRANGKIYAVVAVCLTILLGLFVYLLFIDRKISKLEKQNVSH